MSNRIIVQEGDSHVTVALQRAGQFPEASQSFDFAPPLKPEQLEELRWYLENYLGAPFAVYEERGQAIASQLNSWGEALFGALFGPDKPGHDAYLRSREGGATELMLSSKRAGFLAPPWELLKDPDRADPVALAVSSFDRTFPAAAQASEQASSGQSLRVLMVIARPLGLRDVGYQMIARPLLHRLQAVRGKVQLDVVRPPSFDQLQSRLHQAQEKDQPYQVLHFDGHGSFGVNDGTAASEYLYDAGGAQGYLAFEREDGSEHRVSAGEFALLVNQFKLPLVVLNACRSGKLGNAAAEAAVATRLLEGGAASVVAMGYSVYAVAAAEFMTAFYEELFSGKTTSEAVAAGRLRMYSHNERPSPKGMLSLADWMVPMHYVRRPLSFPQLKTERAKEEPSLQEALDWFNQRREPMPVAGVPAEGSLEPAHQFVGRDAGFYELELALRLQRVVVVHGPGGMGKTELAKAFTRWWRDSGGIDNPHWVLFHSFEPGLPSFGLDGVVLAIGLKLFGPQFIVRTADAEQRRGIVLDALRRYRMLLVWDNFESVYSMPDPREATPALDESQCHAVASFVGELAQHGRSGLIITSRNPEQWLGDVRRLELGGLTSAEASEMAEDVLAPYPRARARRQDRSYAELIQWLGGHPLSLRLVLPQLEQYTPAQLLAALRGEAQALPPGFEANAGQGRLESLGAGVKYSFDQLDAELRENLPALALFEAVVDENVLAAFSTTEGVPARFAKLGKESWAQTLKALTAVGLLTSIGAGMYELHPALPVYLAAQWRRMVGNDYEAEHAAAQGALLSAYAKFGNWLNQQLGSRSAEAAMALLERQRRTMGGLVGLALEQRRYAEAQALLRSLNRFWNARGLVQEARGWVERCRQALESADGTPPELGNDGGSLWLFMLGAEADRSRDAGALDVAEHWHQIIRQRLEASSISSRDRLLATSYHELGLVAQQRGQLDQAVQWYRRALPIREALHNRPGMAMSYHQLGIVAQIRGQLDQAEQWYRKSLTITEALPDRRTMAMSYRQLGLVAEARGDAGAALDWMVRCAALFEQFPHPTTGPGPSHLARLTAQLGIAALEASWQKQTGSKLPEHVRSAVEQMIKQSSP
jgi:tetratricopeptide (TPR) repeat protein